VSLAASIHSQNPTLGAAVELPLLEDDLDSPEFIEPRRRMLDGTDMPSRVVFCFFSEMMDKIAAREDARLIDTLTWAHGPHRVLEMEHRGERLAVVHAGVGAPLAGGLLDEVIALGGQEFVAVGGAGCLVPDLVMGHAVVVDSAVRDEGTSFHYAAASRVIEADPTLVASVEATLTEAGVPFVTGRTWTTDAPYREARTRVARRVDQDGCITVEMEASALLAVAAYRGARLVSLLYSGDSLAGDEWDHRGWHTAFEVREGLFWLAADAALRLPSPS
jgi:uridine phosphorylase